MFLLSLPPPAPLLFLATDHFWKSCHLLNGFLVRPFKHKIIRAILDCSSFKHGSAWKNRHITDPLLNSLIEYYNFHFLYSFLISLHLLPFSTFLWMLPHFHPPSFLHHRLYFSHVIWGEGQQ